MLYKSETCSRLMESAMRLKFWGSNAGTVAQSKSLPPEAVDAEVLATRQRDFVEFLTNFNSGRVTKLDSRIASAAERLTAIRAEIQKLSEPPFSRRRRRRLGSKKTELIQTEGQLSQLDANRRDIIIADYEQQYRAICSVPRVSEVWVHLGRLVYRTNALFGKDHGGAW